MTEYWKSYAKKFCEICKCWYADNKISSERHEMGARHKVMVQQRLRESSKKAKDQEIANHDLRMTILAMEQAARASISENKKHRNVPSFAEEDMSSIETPNQEEQLEDPKAELREQRKMLKELKKKSKQSQLWVEEEQDQLNESHDESDKMTVWVQSETPGGVRYYWHIFSGETRWEQPKQFYTSEEYAENYTKIAAEIDNRNQQMMYEGTSQLPSSSSQNLTHEYISSRISNNYQMHTNMISPKFAPEMEKEIRKPYEDFKTKGMKHGMIEEDALSKEERKRIRKERSALAKAEGPPLMPEGLVELKQQKEEHPAEEKPFPIEMNEPKPEKIFSLAAPANNHPLGAWIPVKKEVPVQSTKPLDDEFRIEKKSKKHYDDLPEQEYGPGSSILAQTPAELLEVAEMDPEELAFKTKELPAERSKKSTKVVGFRRPAGNSTNKSLRNRSGKN